MTQAVTYRDAASWADGLNAPAHLAALGAVQEQDFAEDPELERWGRGVPADQLDQARALWRSWLNEAGRSAQLFRLSLQIGGELPPAERLALYAQAAEACPDPRYRTALCANAASSAVRAGDLESARRWLDQCTPVSDSLIVDGALRIAAATVAISEGRPREAVALLGDRDGAIPLLRSYRQLAMAVRAHALHASGDRAGGDRELDALIASAGETSAAGIVVRLPASWQVDTSRFDLPWRAEEASQARWRIGGGVFSVIGAVAGYVANVIDGDDAADAWFFLAMVGPLLLVLGGWLITTGHRHLRIATQGLSGRGTVVSKSYVRSTRLGRARYTLGVKAWLRRENGDEYDVAASTLSSYGPDEADRWQDRTVRVLFHPEYPRFVLMRNPIRS